MAPRPWPWVAATAICAALAGWLYLDNRQLRDRLSQPGPSALREPTSSGAREPAPGAAPGEPQGRGGLAALARALSAPPAPAPAPPEPPPENRMDRRARRSAEVAQLFGRLDGETEAQYRERVMPMVVGLLERPRQRAAELRHEAEQRAGVTAEQSAKLDQAFAATYDELVDYTNAAVAAGQLSPYQRNVAGWLEYAGGLGGILNGTEGKVGAILRPEQVRTMYDSGFEWGEFLGVNAPWERLNAPPPPR